MLSIDKNYTVFCINKSQIVPDPSIFEILPEIFSIGESGKIEKMSGYSGFYKMRFGVYRVGMKLEKNILVLKTVMHRQKIYQVFP